MIYSDAPNSTIVDSKARYGAFLIVKAMRQLKIGRIYTLQVETTDDKGRPAKRNIDYRLINMYPHQALFIRKIRAGVYERRCFRYMEIAKSIVSEESRQNLQDRLTLPEGPEWVRAKKRESAPQGLVT